MNERQPLNERPPMLMRAHNINIFISENDGVEDVDDDDVVLGDATATARTLEHCGFNFDAQCQLTVNDKCIHRHYECLPLAASPNALVQHLNFHHPQIMITHVSHAYTHAHSLAHLYIYLYVQLVRMLPADTCTTSIFIYI